MIKSGMIKKLKNIDLNNLVRNHTGFRWWDE